MMLTREQAAETWCPMVRIARHEVTVQRRPAFDGMELVTEQHHVVAGCNTDALGGTRVPASCRCIADKCAMWRWGETSHEWKTKVVDAPEMGPGGKRAVEVPVDVPTRGYCGLAGTPLIGAAS